MEDEKSNDLTDDVVKTTEEEKDEDISPEEGHEDDEMEVDEVEKENEESFDEEIEEEVDVEEDLDETKVPPPVERVQWWTKNSDNTNTSSSFDFEKKTDDNQNVCAICGTRGEVVCCDGRCKRSFHLQCLNILPEELPEGKWMCADCETSEKKGSIDGKDTPRSAKSPRKKVSDSAEQLSLSVAMTPEKKIMRSVVGVVEEMSTQNVNKDVTEKVIKGINYMIQIAEPRENFEIFGSELLQVLLDLCVVAGPGIRDLIFPHVERLSVRWKQKNKETILEGVGKPNRIVKYALGIHCLERVAMSHQLKKSLETAINKADRESRKYLGFDISTGPPTQNGSKSVRTYMLAALKRSHVLDALDFRIGPKYVDVFKWIKVARPYYDFDKMDSFEAFREQTNLVVGVVMTLTNNGKLRIHPSLLPYEHDFLTKSETFQIWMNQEEDCGMVGELVHACLCFGIAEDNESKPPMMKAREWLLSKQREDGGWFHERVEKKSDENVVESSDILKMKNEAGKIRREFLDTSACVRALVRSNFVGFGPNCVEMLKILRDQAEKLRAAQNARLEPKRFPCGVSYSSLSTLALSFVKHQYEDGGAGTSDGLPLAERGAKRLDELLLRREEKIITLRNKELDRKDRYMPRRKRRRRS